jgi:hypothetical protein
LELKRRGYVLKQRALDDEVDSLRFEVDAIVASDDSQTGHGVGCWTGEGTTNSGRPDGAGYVVAISGAGEYSILRDPLAEPPEAIVVRSAAAVTLKDGANRVGVECIRREDAVTIVFRLNGAAIAVAKDDGSTGPFTSIGMVATNSQGGGDVRFDNAEARELSEEEASAAAARPVTPEEFVIQLPYEDDFAVVCEWPRATHAQSSAACVEGQFAVQLEQPTTRMMHMGLDQEVDAVRFEVDMTPGQTGPEASQSYGLGCWTNGQADHAEPPAGDGYNFITAPDAGWAFYRLASGKRPQKLVLLALPGTLDLASNTNTFGADCVFRDGKTTLVMRLNGAPIAVLRRRGGQPFGWIGLVASGDAGSEVLFDNARARVLTDDEADLVAMMDVTPTPTGEPFADAGMRQLGVVDDPYD